MPPADSALFERSGLGGLENWMRVKTTRNPRMLRKFSKVDEGKLGQSERHHAKAAALIAGAEKLMSDFIGNQSWGTEITIDVSLELLEEAKRERAAGAFMYKNACALPKKRSLGKRSR